MHTKTIKTTLKITIIILSISIGLKTATQIIQNLEGEKTLSPVTNILSTLTEPINTAFCLILIVIFGLILRHGRNLSRATTRRQKTVDRLSTKGKVPEKEVTPSEYRVRESLNKKRAISEIEETFLREKLKELEYLRKVRKIEAEEYLEKERFGGIKSSISVNINGQWGSGKSFLMNKMIELMKPQQHIITLAPWQINKGQNIQDSYIDELSIVLDSMRDFPDSKNAIVDLQKYKTEFARVRLEYSGFGIQNIPEMLEESESLTTLKKSVMKHFLSLESPIYVILDDLDRAKEEDIKNIVAIMGSSFNFPNIIYLTCSESEKIDKILGSGVNNKEKYRSETPMNKIVDLVINVPSYSTQENDLKGIIQNNNLGESFSSLNQNEYWWNDISYYYLDKLTRRETDRISEKLNYIFDEPLINSNDNDTLRDLKAQISALLVYEVFRFFYPEELEEIRQYRSTRTPSVPGIVIQGLRETFSKQKVESGTEESHKTPLEKIEKKLYVNDLHDNRKNVLGFLFQENIIGMSRRQIFLQRYYFYKIAGDDPVELETLKNIYNALEDPHKGEIKIEDLDSLSREYADIASRELESIIRGSTAKDLVNLLKKLSKTLDTDSDKTQRIATRIMSIIKDRDIPEGIIEVLQEEKSTIRASFRIALLYSMRKDPDRLKKAIPKLIEGMKLDGLTPDEKNDIIQHSLWYIFFPENRQGSIENDIVLEAFNHTSIPLTPEEDSFFKDMTKSIYEYCVRMETAGSNVYSVNGDLVVDENRIPKGENELKDEVIKLFEGTKYEDMVVEILSLMI